PTAVPGGLMTWRCCAATGSAIARPRASNALAFMVGSCWGDVGSGVVRRISCRVSCEGLKSLITPPLWDIPVRRPFRHSRLPVAALPPAIPPSMQARPPRCRRRPACTVRLKHRAQPDAAGERRQPGHAVIHPESAPLARTGELRDEG